MTTTEEKVHAGNENAEKVLQALENTYAQNKRSPVLHRPSEEGLEYENVTFPSTDGVPLEGWFVPAPGSTKVVIANHPLGFSRSGMPSHLEPWHSIWGPSGNGFEVNLIPDLKVLHDAGYHVLAYDLRNLGLSGSANGGVAGSGVFESRDVLGSLQYIRQRPDTEAAEIALLSRCLGASATLYAMKTHPEAFQDIKSMVAPEPVIPRVLAVRQLELAGLSAADYIDEADKRIKIATGFGFDERDTVEWATHVCVPTLMYQVRDEVLTSADEIQKLFDKIPVDDKELVWIEDTKARWDGYLEFQRRPQKALDFFAKHFS